VNVYVFNCRNVNHVYVWEEMQERMSHASMLSSDCGIMLMVISSGKSLCFEVCNASLQGGSDFDRMLDRNETSDTTLLMPTCLEC